MLAYCPDPTPNPGQVLFEAQGRGGKNKAVDLEDMKFHQCVRLARFENDRTISFIPPDGAFDLMCAPMCTAPSSSCMTFQSTAAPVQQCLRFLLVVNILGDIYEIMFAILDSV